MAGFCLRYLRPPRGVGGLPFSGQVQTEKPKCFLHVNYKTLQKTKKNDEGKENSVC